MLPPAKQVLPRQVLPFRGDWAGSSAQREDPLPRPPPGTQLEGSARRPDHRPEPASGYGRSLGGSGSGAGAGAAGRRGELRPSTFPTPGSRPRAESTPTCCARERPDFPAAPEGGRAALAAGRPRAPLSPSRQGPAPEAVSPPSPASSLPRGPGFRHHFAAATAPGSSKRLHSRCRPGARSLQPAGSPTPPPAREPLRSRDPQRLVLRGVPHGSAHVPVPLRRRQDVVAGTQLRPARS